ncbi:hypothetical protein N866_05105 [Actinotalea ferrariae CF5-4]|uniref:Uncharacterized protein n=1 Tax=Actinotalea ferrariae CF5-4 TaxID=948458 RepID=A0A021VUP4_9CELL|nr:hypothetical protein N866_05105 [Actinotalea ferrariae CF5-4]
MDRSSPEVRAAVDDVVPAETRAELAWTIAGVGHGAEGWWHGADVIARSADDRGVPSRSP